MSFKRLVTLLLLVSVLFTGIVPVMAQGDGYDIEARIAEYMPTLPAGFGGVDVADVAIELVEDPPFLLDVREVSEWMETGYIEGAVNVPVREIAQHLGLLPADLDTPIVVYCAAGTRGAIGMTVLQILGYTDVRNMRGGIRAWMEAGNDVVTDEVEFEAIGPADIDPGLVAAVDNYLTNVLPQGWGMVSASDLNIELVENPPFLLDVRETSELEANGYIEGALHVAIRDIPMHLDELPTDQPIVVYCASGWRGSIAMVALQMLGYDARNLSGGISAWLAEDYPVVGGTTEEPAADAGFSVESMVADYLPNLPDGFGGVNPADVALELVENPPFLLDVREVSEWMETGYIEGAVNVPVREIAQHLDLLPADLDTPIVVYCAAGTRGAIGMTVLQMMGYTDVRNMRGGIRAWMEAGNPVVTDEVEFEAIGPADFDPAMVEAVDDYLTNVLPQGWGMVSASDLNIELTENPPFLLDVRETSELEANGYIEGALHVAIREIPAHLDELPADQPIVVYCASGWRGSIAMVALQMLGYDARNLSGGINSWLAEDYPVVGAAEEAAGEGDTADSDMVVEIPLPEGTPLDAEVVGPLAYEAAITLAGEAGFGTITEETRQADYADAYLLDVREVSEYEEGFIPGAVNVPLREVAQNLYLLPEDQSAPIVVYCAAGHRGAIAEIALELLGYDNVTSLRSGIRAYTGELSTEVPATGMHAFPEIDPDLWASVDVYLTAIPAGFYGIGAEDLALGLTEGELTVIDVREPSEYEGGAIEGAINVPLRSFTEQLDQLPAQDASIVVYGSIGHRSALAMVAMQMAGFEDVRSFAGGSGGWTAAGYELVTP